MTITITVSRKPKFGKKAWVVVAKREATVERLPTIEEMLDSFGTEIGGFESADGSQQGWDFVQPDPIQDGMSLMTEIVVKEA